LSPQKTNDIVSIYTKLLLTLYLTLTSSDATHCGRSNLSQRRISLVLIGPTIPSIIGTTHINGSSNNSTELSSSKETNSKYCPYFRMLLPHTTHNTQFNTHNKVINILYFNRI